MATWVVIKTGGKQYKVAEGEKIEIEKISPGRGEDIAFDEVLLVVDGQKVTLGKPLVAKARVKALVLEDFKDKKIRVVKFKPKSRYLRQTGHRQAKTRVLIEKILPGQ
ncbi:50S ribosomal protein L21 [Candidatus Curtissbacteria bacterium]|nr:50S ribosomal protein L21 [Candidatus Curtissbacteria bacterium]